VSLQPDLRVDGPGAPTIRGLYYGPKHRTALRAGTYLALIRMMDPRVRELLRLPPASWLWCRLTPAILRLVQ